MLALRGSGWPASRASRRRCGRRRRPWSRPPGPCARIGLGSAAAGFAAAAQRGPRPARRKSGRPSRRASDGRHAGGMFFVGVVSERKTRRFYNGRFRRFAHDPTNDDPPPAPAPPDARRRRSARWPGPHTARFLTTASQLDQLPPAELPEIAFVGRSNAGKSTAINTLTQQKRLAFASKTPGRTQHINLFALGPEGRARRAVRRPARLRLRGGGAQAPSCAGSR